jgi:ELWxxDGT repeat protein
MAGFSRNALLLCGLLACAATCAATPAAEVLVAFPETPYMFNGLRPELGWTTNSKGDRVPALYFSVRSETPPTYRMWVSDGTSEGTHPAASSGLNVIGISRVSQTIGAFFTADDGSGSAQVFYTQGTESSVRQLTQIPVNASTLAGVIGNDALLTRPGTTGQSTIWRVNGDTGVAIPLGLLPGSNGELATAGGNIIAPSRSGAVNDHVSSFPDAGSSILDLVVPSPSTIWDYPHRIASGSRIACFKAFTHYDAVNVRQELYCTDGTTIGTTRPADSGGTGIPLWDDVTFHPLGEKFLFYGVAGAPYGSPWFTDGTNSGTYPLLDGYTSSWSSCSIDRSGRIYFVADRNGEGKELWVTDGTLEGTQKINGIPGNYSGCSWKGTSVSTSGMAYLQFDQTLMQTDGTTEGTVPVAGVPDLRYVGTQNDPFVGIVALGRWLVFAAPVSATQGGLWRLDLDPVFAGGFED